MKRTASILLIFLLLPAVCGISPLYAHAKNRPVTLTIWELSVNESLMQNLIHKFELENPGIKVNLQQLTWEYGLDKFIISLAAGNAPDICELGTTWIAQFAQAGALLDITDHVSEDKDKYFLWESATYEGRIYGVPCFAGTRVLFYNKDLFQSAGLDPEQPPRTWDELIAAARKIYAPDKGQWGFSIFAGEPESPWQEFLPFMWSNGATVLDADLKRCTLSSPETVATLQFYKKLSQFSLIERQAQVNELFAEGKVGMQISGSWNLRLIPQLNPQLRFGTALMPKARANGRNPDAFAGGELFVVTKRSHHPAEALKLIHFLTAQENVMEIVRYQQNVVPARRDTLQEPYYEQFPEQKVFLLQLANASPAPIHPRWNELQEHITRLVEEVIMNNADPAKAAAAATAKIDALINEDVVAGKIPGSLVNIFVCAIGALFLAILFLAGRARSRLAKDHAGTRMKNRDYSAFFYLSPWFAIFLAFGLYPLLYSFVISLAKYDILTSQFGFVGIKNYLTALGDKDFRRALWHTFVFAAGTVPFTAGLSLFCAILINRKIRFKQVFQAGLFLPVTTSVVVIATIFTYIYSPNGLANALLDRLGIMHPQSSWLNCPRSRFGISVSLISIMAMNIWSSFGYYTILFLAGLQTIPDKLYEMASLDGATEWHKFRYITYPQIKPTLLLVVVINTIYSLQVFPEIFTMTMGGPLGSTTTAVYYLYETGFHRFEMGQASAIGYLLAIIIALFSIAQMSILKTAERPEE